MKSQRIEGSEILNPKSEKRDESKGTLYIVSTPIGNLEDITLRALRILRSVDLIAAEGVKHSRSLCRYYGIKTRLTSYNQHNQKVKVPELITKLKSGFDIALVTNAGTPGISDPGSLLIGQALDAKIEVSPVPGPSAVTAALSVSGLRADSFLFIGFLSSRSGKRRKELRNLLSEPHTMVFLEAPHRLQAMLLDVREILGDRQVVLLKELTKLYEEVRRGSVGSILKQLEIEKIRGEFTLVVAGKGKDHHDVVLDEKIQKRIEKLLKDDQLSTKDVATKLSEEQGLTYREVYKECIAIKRANRLVQGR